MGPTLCHEIEVFPRLVAIDKVRLDWKTGQKISSCWQIVGKDRDPSGRQRCNSPMVVGCGGAKENQFGGEPPVIAEAEMKAGHLGQR